MPDEPGDFAAQGVPLPGLQSPGGLLQATAAREGSRARGSAHGDLAAVSAVRYRRSAAWLGEGEHRVKRMWARMGLNLPRRRPRRRRSGTDMRMLGAIRPNHVWTYDFVHDRLAGKRTIRLLCVLDEHTRECLAIEVATSITSREVVLTLTRLMRLYGKPAFIRSDQGAEFTADACHEVAAGHERRAELHSAGKALAQRLRGKLQRKAARRMLEPGVVPGSAGSQVSHRELAAVLQPLATALRPWVSTSGPSAAESRNGGLGSSLIGYKFGTQVRVTTP